MSTPSHPPSAPSPVELETVTCWPLIFGAVGFVCLGLLAVTGFAAWSALFPPPKSAAVVEAPKPAPAYVRSEPIELPAQPMAGTDNERQVKMRREVVGWYNPLPPVRKSAKENQQAKTAKTPSLPPKRARLAGHKSVAETIPSSLKLPIRSEHELLNSLWKKSSEIDLHTETGAAKRMFEESKKHMERRRDADKKESVPLTKTIREVLDSRNDLRGLPLQDEKDCQSTPEVTNLLAKVSPRVRRLQPSPAILDEEERMASDSAYARYVPKFNEHLLRYVRETTKEYGKAPAIVRPMEQMIQTERMELRRGLVESLAVVEGKKATEAIARRAVFDLSPEVRGVALKALAKRSLDEARPTFLAALRHPWAPAAEHAALALTELNDQKAFDSVRKLTDLPDPARPFQEGKQWYVREVVRVNHLRNCLLCHAVSLDNRDLVRAPIPTPGEPLPRGMYYERRSPLNSIRADIVYFRQDFSVMHPVARSRPWPARQRFDYLVRKRELTAKEINKLLTNAPEDKTADQSNYPQRDAVLYTLYQLAFAKRKPAEPSR